MLWLVPYALSLKGQENGNHFLWRNALRNCGILSPSNSGGLLNGSTVLRQGVGGRKDMLPNLGSASYGLTVAWSNKHFQLPGIQSLVSKLLWQHLTLSFTHLLTEMKWDLPTIIKTKENLPPAEGIYHNNNILGSTDPGRVAGQAHVFGLALRNEDCQRGKDEKHNPSPHKPNNGLGNLMLKLSGWQE